MKSLDELKGPRVKRKKKQRKTAAVSPTSPPKRTGFKRNAGVPIMPKSGSEADYDLRGLYDTFDL